MLVTSYSLSTFSYHGMRNLIYASNERRVCKETDMASGFAEPLTVLHQYRDSERDERFEQPTRDVPELEDSRGFVSRRPNVEKAGIGQC